MACLPTETQRTLKTMKTRQPVPNDYDEFKILCDLYGQERTDEPRWVALEVWWWSDIVSGSC